METADDLVADRRELFRKLDTARERKTHAEGEVSRLERELEQLEERIRVKRREEQKASLNTAEEILEFCLAGCEQLQSFSFPKLSGNLISAVSTDDEGPVLYLALANGQTFSVRAVLTSGKRSEREDVVVDG